MRMRPTKMIDEMVEFVRKEYAIDMMNRKRLEPIVIARAALFNVCRGYYSATMLAKYFGMNHATILHHIKNHDNLLVLAEYRKIHDQLMDILSIYDKDARIERKLRIENIEYLRKENERLTTIVGRYKELFGSLSDIEKEQKEREDEEEDSEVLAQA